MTFLLCGIRFGSFGFRRMLQTAARALSASASLQCLRRAGSTPAMISATGTRDGAGAKLSPFSWTLVSSSLSWCLDMFTIHYCLSISSVFIVVLCRSQLLFVHEFVELPDLSFSMALKPLSVRPSWPIDPTTSQEAFPSNLVQLTTEPLPKATFSMMETVAHQLSKNVGKKLRLCSILRFLTNGYGLSDLSDTC